MLDEKVMAQQARNGDSGATPKKHKKSK